jgi:cAMP phosphodiesterase
MRQRQTSKNIISQGRNNEGFTTFGDCPQQRVQANEDYIAWWRAILFHFHQQFFKKNSCVFFEGQRKSV